METATLFTTFSGGEAIRLKKGYFLKHIFSWGSHVFEITKVTPKTVTLRTVKPSGETFMDGIFEKRVMVSDPNGKTISKRLSKDHTLSGEGGVWVLETGESPTSSFDRYNF